MDIVVRTPHGDADISIVEHDDATTLGDVIAAVTGQAVPRLALVDGRAVDCSTRLVEAGLLIGSVVTTDPPLPVATAPDGVRVVQVAGFGTGRVARLEPGRYRIGPGRRPVADELALGPVDRAAVELVVEPTATARSHAIVVPADEATTELDGSPVEAPRPWREETLFVGSRAFRLESLGDPAGGAPAPTTGSRSTPATNGTVPFSRAPRRDDRPRRPVVDALLDATGPSARLWARRPDHPDAFSLPFAVTAGRTGPDTIASATLDLAADRAVAIAGSERFRSALARTLVCEVTTLHGPADVDLAILTRPDRIAEWDWAKWLPHTRRDGPPAIWSSPDDVDAWVQRATGSDRPSATSPPAAQLTIAVLDDPGLWNRRDSPLRSVLSNPPDSLRLIALCDDPTEAPAICTAVVAATPTGLARLRSHRLGTDLEDLRVSLTETAIAAQIARALAPLEDTELPVTAAADDAPVDLDEVVGAGSPEEILRRWGTNRPSMTLTVGRRGRQRVEIASDDTVTEVLGSSFDDAVDVAMATLLARCVDRPPEALWVVPLVTDERLAQLWSLPHAVERVGGAIDPGRLLARCRAVLDDPAGPDQVLVVLERSRRTPASLDDGVLHDLVNGARATSGLALVVVSDVVGAGAEVDADTVITVELDWRDHDGRRRRTASLVDRGVRHRASFRPVERGPHRTSLEVRPAVIGRPLTPLERRIEQRAGHDVAADPAIATVVARLQQAATRWVPAADPTPRIAVAPPLPAHIDLEELFASAPGDAVPLGRADDPATGEFRPRWWAPGDGSILAVGSRRSGVEQVLATIVLGLLDRFPAEEVRLVVVEPSTARRRALLDTGLVGAVRAPDRADEIAQTLDEIEAELTRQASAATAPPPVGPRLVVVITDLPLVRVRYASTPDSRLDDVLAAAGAPGSGVDVIAAAGDLDGAGPFAASAAQRVVGVPADPSDLAALGVDDPGGLEGIVGRCRWFPDDQLVQLAMPDAILETLLTRRTSGGSP